MPDLALERSRSCSERVTSKRTESRHRGNSVASLLNEVKLAIISRVSWQMTFDMKGRKIRTVPTVA